MKQLKHRTPKPAPKQVKVVLTFLTINSQDSYLWIGRGYFYTQADLVQKSLNLPPLSTVICTPLLKKDKSDFCTCLSKDQSPKQQSITIQISFDICTCTDRGRYAAGFGWTGFLLFISQVHVSVIIFFYGCNFILGAKCKYFNMHNSLQHMATL